MKIFSLFFFVTTGLGICEVPSQTSPFVASGVTTIAALKKEKDFKFTPVNINALDAPEYVLEMAQGKVYEDGIILTPDDQLIEDVTVIGYKKSINNHRLLKLKKTNESPKSIQTLDRVVVIASAGSENYYHWMLQILPRIKILQQSGIKWDKLYFFDINKKYQFDSLEQLGIRKEQIIIGAPDEVLQAQVLIIPSIPVWPTRQKVLPMWVPLFLRSQFLKETSSSLFPRKIFISRARALKRRIIDEDQVFQKLESLGFSKVELEDLSVIQQATLFHQAEIVVGAHGSGLTNLVYCEPHTQLIEINGPEGHNEPFRGMAKKMGIDYKDVSCSKKKLSPEQTENEDIYVDIPSLLNAINARRAGKELV